MRLGWDTASPAFGRFEFLCRHGELGRQVLGAARAEALTLRVFAAADWPSGSRSVFDSPDDLDGSFDVARQRGQWWELGRKHPLPEALDHVCSAALGREAQALFEALLPLLDRADGLESRAP
jgi:hypothetical protein